MISRLFFSSQRRSGSWKMMKRHGLNTFPCIIPQLIWIGGVAPKWLP